MLAIVAASLAAIDSYRDHSRVREQTLRLLQSEAASALSFGPGSNSPAAPDALDGSLLAGPSLPIGTVVPIGPFVGEGSPGSGEVGSTVPETTDSSGGAVPPVPTVSIAVLTPFLSTMQFGASVGFLLVCNTGVGTLSAAAAQVEGLSQVLEPVISEISPQCSSLSATAVDGLNELNANLAVLQGLTPATAPYFEQLDKTFETLNEIAPRLQPLTGTIMGLGPLVEFFSGQPAGT